MFISSFTTDSDLYKIHKYSHRTRQDLAYELCLRTCHNQHEIAIALEDIKRYTKHLERPKRFDRLHRIIPQLERLNKALPKEEYIPVVEEELFSVDVLMPLRNADMVDESQVSGLMSEEDNEQYRLLVDANNENDYHDQHCK